MLERLGVAGIIDEVAGARRRRRRRLGVGTYLALATANRVVAAVLEAGASRTGGPATAADRFTKVPAAALDHRRFWDAMDAGSPPSSCADRGAGDRRPRWSPSSVWTCPALALDMTNFATFIDSAQRHAPRSPSAGNAKQKRADLRLVGLGLVVTRDGGIPLAAHTYPGNRPDVTQFTTMIDRTRRRHAVLTAVASPRPQRRAVTVVFDAGQNSAANFAHLAAAGLHFVGSLPPADYPDLLAHRRRRRRPVDADRFPGLTAWRHPRRRSTAPSAGSSLTHSTDPAPGPVPRLRPDPGQGRPRPGRAGRHPGPRQDPPRPRRRADRRSPRSCTPRWVTRVLSVDLTGDTPTSMRLTCTDRHAPPAAPWKPRCSANAC